MRAKARARVEEGGFPAAVPAIDGMDWGKLGPLLAGLAHADRAMKAAGRGINSHYELGRRGAWILSQISSGVRLPADLAAAFFISRSLMTIELNRVIKAGLVDARPSIVDGRRTELALTPLGEAACRQLREETARIIRRNLAGYSAGELDLLMRALTDVQRTDADDGLRAVRHLEPR